MMCIGMSDPACSSCRRTACSGAFPRSPRRNCKRSSARASRPASPAKGPTWPIRCGMRSKPPTTRGTLGFFAAKDERWVVAKLTDEGRKQLAEIASERSDGWRELGVSILHKLVIDKLLGAAGHPTPKYVHLVEEVVEGLETGESPSPRWSCPRRSSIFASSAATASGCPPRAPIFIRSSSAAWFSIRWNRKSLSCAIRTSNRRGPSAAVRLR